MAGPRYKKVLSDTGRVLTDTGRDFKMAVWEWLTGRSWKAFIIVIVATLLVGTFGYWIMADPGSGVGPIDSIYMALITMTTVGYGDAGFTGSGAKLFSLFYTILGVGVYSLSFSRIASAMVEGRITAVLGRRRMQMKIDQLTDHIVLCGYGRFGQITALEFARKGINVVAIDIDPDIIDEIDEPGIYPISADATEENTLLQAGIQRARALCCALPTDAENVYTILTARDIREDIPVTALARDRKAERKLRVAGATDVISPYTIGARHMARQIISPHVARVVKLATGRTGGRKQTGMYMEEVTIQRRSRLDGVSLRDSPIRQEFNVMVVAIIDRGGEVSFNPGPDHVLNGDDVLVAVGADAGLCKLEEATGNLAEPTPDRTEL